MARARFIRPEFFTDEKVSDLPFGACLLFQGIWCHSDLRGVFKSAPRLLRGLIFPMRDGIETGTVGEWLGLIEAQGMVDRFEAAGKSWGHVKHWNEHQSASPREVETWTKRPAPPGWVDPKAWDGYISGAIKAGRIKNDPRTVLEQFRNFSPSPSPTPTPTMTMTMEPPPPPPSWSIGSLMARHPRIYIGKGEGPQWQSVMDEFGQTPVEEGCAEIAGKLKTGQRILLSVLTGWLADNYKRRDQA